MWRNIVKTYRAVDEFLTMCVDYVELRVRTGKFVGDIKQASQLGKEKSQEEAKAFVTQVKTAEPYQVSISTSKEVNTRISKIPVLENFFSVLLHSILIIKNNFNEFLCIIIISLLLMLFITTTSAGNPNLFFLSILPLLLVNSLTISAFYTMVDKKENAIKTTIFAGIPQALKTFFSVTFLFFLNIFTIMDILIVLLVSAFLISVIFELLSITWETSFIFWFFVIAGGFVALITSFFVTIVTLQAYYFVLLENNKILPSLIKSWHLLRAYVFQFLFFYLFLFLCVSSLLFWATVTYLEIGFALVALLFNHAIILIGYVLRKKFPSKQIESSEPSFANASLVFTFLLGLGILSYSLFTILIVEVNPQIMKRIMQKQEEFFLTKSFVSYNNRDVGYAIDYPKSWYIYEWNKQSVTIYNNSTSTRIGAISVTIDVASGNEATFSALFNHRAGLVTFDTTSQDIPITYKITNSSIYGHDAVKYTVTKQSIEAKQYQTHYLISKDGLTYDIALKTVDKNIEGQALPIFEKMIASFRFLE